MRQMRLMALPPMAALCGEKLLLVKMYHRLRRTSRTPELSQPLGKTCVSVSPVSIKENTTDAIDLQKRETRLAAHKAASHGSASDTIVAPSASCVNQESGLLYVDRQQKASPLMQMRIDPEVQLIRD